MSISMLVAIAGVLVAAVGTGLLGGRCIRSPAASFIAWTAAMLAVTVALLAQSIGFVSGFGPATFRAIQISAQLVAPVALAWGLAELVARGPVARFGARAAAGGLVVVAGVILATDPLAARAFGTAWPSAAAHYRLIPHYVLIALDLAVSVTAVAAVSLCAARARSSPAGRPSLPGPAAIAAATVALMALRFPLPASAAYPALTAGAAGLVWLGMSRINGAIVDRAAPVPSRAARGAVRTGVAGRDRPPAPAAARAAGEWPASEPWPAAEWQADQWRRDQWRRDQWLPGPGPGRPDPDDLAGADDPGSRADVPVDGARRRGRDPRPYPPGAPGAAAGPGDRGEPAAGRGRFPGLAGSAPARPSPGAVQPPAPPYGLIAIYTLLEDRVADFDRIADQAAEEVRTHERDTLVYVIHTVPKAPMQRIFYEVYRDRAAYDRHEQQSYIKRFGTARRPYVLATNVIELRLRYAKISPLGQASPPAGTSPPEAVGAAEASGAGPAAAAFPAGTPAQAGPRPLGRSRATGEPDGGAYPAGRGNPPAAARGRSQELPAAQRRYRRI
ncbi:MAG: putative quinol monooxygenase [Streptosporangiaceae bacterium]